MAWNLFVKIILVLLDTIPLQINKTEEQIAREERDNRIQQLRLERDERRRKLRCENSVAETSNVE